MKPKPSGFAVLAILLLIVAVLVTVLTSTWSSRPPVVHKEPPALTR
jgi:hypothetical protein